MEDKAKELEDMQASHAQETANLKARIAELKDELIQERDSRVAPA